MSIISKELLSEVLCVHVRDDWYFDCEILVYTYDKILGLDENYKAEINIYELAFLIRDYFHKKYKHDLDMSLEINEIFKNATQFYESVL